jgi:hypothetical protein
MLRVGSKVGPRTRKKRWPPLQHRSRPRPGLGLPPPPPPAPIAAFVWGVAGAAGLAGPVRLRRKAPGALGYVSHRAAVNTLCWWPTTRPVPVSNPPLRATRPTPLRSLDARRHHSTLQHPLRVLLFTTTRGNRTELVRDKRASLWIRRSGSRHKVRLLARNGLWQGSASAWCS